MTTIEWCQNDDGSRGKTWNPIRGCSRVSAGCDECYAMKFAHRFSGAGKPYEGLTTIRRGKVDWSGVARFIPEELDAPLRWRKPQRVFVNSMSDLFYHWITNEQIAAVFGVMASCPRHTFQILTKRPERALEFFAWLNGGDGYLHRINDAVCDVLGRSCVAFPTQRHGMVFHPGWPLPNVHLGVSVENQAAADKRIPLLLKCPAAVRWISAEPLIEPVNLRGHLLADGPTRSAGQGAHVASCECGHGHGFTRCPNTGDIVTACHYAGCACPGFRRVNGIRWVVIGGESGPGARPYDLAWPRSIIAQCRAAGVQVFHKQVGSKPFEHVTDAFVVERRFRDSKGGDPSEWPDDLRVREFPEARHA
ncbi:MAG TPA: DUF5131 family protein [Jiangellaceae bacterium]|nr:DUF5131 family protein [Jiangellaceae bacterium]